MSVNQGSRKNVVNRNEILKELRQEYEILKNLNIEDSIHVHVKKYDKDYKASESAS